MSSEKTNILEQYCRFRGWQGGTIHQAKEDYRALPVQQKYDFCLILIRVLLDLTDQEGVAWFVDLLQEEIGEPKAL